jgi:hypothetical protein
MKGKCNSLSHCLGVPASLVGEIFEGLIEVLVTLVNVFYPFGFPVYKISFL